jgi:hypothetical protein
VEARATNEEFTLMPLGGIGNNLCYAADIPSSKEEIEGYYRHAIKFNNINGTMRIRTSLDIGKLKRLGTSFNRYLNGKKVLYSQGTARDQGSLVFEVDPQSTPCIFFSWWNEVTTSGNDEQRI